MKDSLSFLSLLLFLLLLLLVLPPSYAQVRVINGDRIGVTKAPYIAALLENPEGTHICGGTILSSRVIATAAHCLEDPKLLKFVRVGSDLDWRGGQLIEVYKMVHHSKYTSYHEVDATYDYGVVILKTPIIFNRNITVAHLARRRLPEGTMLTLSGYGSGRVLKQTRIPIYNQRECIANYAYIPLEVDPHVSFCAGYKYANTTSCFGDSGGPLIYGKRLLYGIVSWGDDDCQVQDFPAVYSRVDTMAEWFQSFMDEYK